MSGRAGQGAAPPGAVPPEQGDLLRAGPPDPAVGEDLTQVVEQDDAVAEKAPALVGVGHDHFGGIVVGGFSRRAGRTMCAHGDHHLGSGSPAGDLTRAPVHHPVPSSLRLDGGLRFSRRVANVSCRVLRHAGCPSGPGGVDGPGRPGGPGEQVDRPQGQDPQSHRAVAHRGTGDAASRPHGQHRPSSTNLFAIACRHTS
jgi:hypothetical protein